MNSKVKLKLMCTFFFFDKQTHVYLESQWHVIGVQAVQTTNKSNRIKKKLTDLIWFG
jgi:hypothetical protein